MGLVRRNSESCGSWVLDAEMMHDNECRLPRLPQEARVMVPGHEMTSRLAM